MEAKAPNQTATPREIGSTENRLPFYFIVAVWDTVYVDVFLNATLPTLLAPGNLPSLRNPTKSKFLIFTLPSDQSRMMSAQSFRRLSTLMPVEFHPIPSITPDMYATASGCYRTAMQRVYADDAIAIFPPADCIFSDGSINLLEKLAVAGKTVVYVIGLRLVREDVMSSLSGFLSQDGAIIMPPRELAAFGLSHLHGIALSHFGRWQEALADYNTATPARPDCAGILLERSAVLTRLGREAEAQESRARAAQLSAAATT